MREGVGGLPPSFFIPPVHPPMKGNKVPVKKLTPDADLETNYVVWEGQKLEVRTKFKVGKFLRLINTDPGNAIALILTDDALEKFDELEFTMDEFGEFMTELAGAIGASDQKN